MSDRLRERHTAPGTGVMTVMVKSLAQDYSERWGLSHKSRICIQSSGVVRLGLGPSHSQTSVQNSAKDTRGPREKIQLIHTHRLAVEGVAGKYLPNTLFKY